MVQLIRAAFAALALTTAALAVDFSDPKSVVEAAYEPYLSQDFDWSTHDGAALQSKELAALYERDARESEAAGEIGRIDFDPLINGQDYEITNLDIREPKVSGDTATVQVVFENFGTANSIQIVLVNEGGWKIDDVKSTDGELIYSLRDMLEAPYP